MKYPMGPHRRRGRRRRRLKALIIAAVLLMMLLSSNWMPWMPPKLVKRPSVQEVVVARNLYKASGDNGYPHEFLTAHPEYTAYITGEAATPEECEAVG